MFLYVFDVFYATLKKQKKKDQPCFVKSITDIIPSSTKVWVAKESGSEGQKKRTELLLKNLQDFF